MKKSIEDVNNLLFMNNRIDTCDVGILFGGVSMIPNRADAAIKLYNDKIIKKILVSGNKSYLNPFRHTKEANDLYEYLINKGVKKEDILIEDKSKDTITNVKYSIKLLSKLYDINNITIMIITSDFHVKRCLTLLSRYIKEDHIFYYGVLNNITDKNNWFNNKYGRKIIKREQFLLKHLKKK